MQPSPQHLEHSPDADASSPFRWIALGGFYVFVFLTGALVFADEPAARRLATTGMGSAATMWWVCDAMKRRNDIPFASLWICVAFYPIVVTQYYFSTRGVSGIPRYLAHVASAAALFIGAVWFSISRS